MSKSFQLILLSIMMAFITSQVTYPYTCQPADRSVEICSTQYQGVCGLFNTSIQCIKAPCGQTYDNVCNACKNSQVASVVLGECDKQTTTTTPSSTTPSSTSSPTMCAASQRGMACTMEFRGVCATYVDRVTCDQKPCVKTTGTTCQACSDENIASVVDGSCPADSKNINLNVGSTAPPTNDTPTTTTCSADMRAKVCTAEYLGVCAFYDDSVSCDSKPCMKTMGTVCTACSDAKVAKVTTGVCVADSKNVNLNSASGIYMGLVFLLSFLFYI
jgi:hypothetical protein